MLMTPPSLVMVLSRVNVSSISLSYGLPGLECVPMFLNVLSVAIKASTGKAYNSNLKLTNEGIPYVP